ncbi:cupin domain-containing protein [Ensifer sp. HO-A22]|uniref:Cupin domain-containing protein n=1 Tax=Ensifer oleiphilus TaxID=2742698 RepID=A0A7Y6QAB5_9HYPH|nr:cupin domain-containing protein [Ensifer oleiphilus]NVD41906.1 cupin domain-containing protein [Ensifer oleiphilus]
MNVLKSIVAAGLITGTAFVLSAQAQQNSQLQRTDLVHNDISAPGLKIVQARVDFAPGAISIKHSHPGEEVAFVLEGSIEYQLEGRSPVTLKTGQSLFIPAGTAHIAKNVGDGDASELATYVVKRDVPLVVQEK